MTVIITQRKYQGPKFLSDIFNYKLGIGVNEKSREEIIEDSPIVIRGVVAKII